MVGYYRYNLTTALEEAQGVVEGMDYATYKLHSLWK